MANNGSATWQTSEWGTVCLVNTVNNVTNWLFYLMSAVAVLLFIVGAVFYMAAGGSPDAAKKGKAFIIFAIVGIVIALVAKMIPSLVKAVIG
jgi:membrane-associated HD superfamily phosphohydrolase